jgi:hypothetical protein
MQQGLIYGLFCSSHRPKLHPLDQPLDLGMPLLIPSASAMSRQAQENIIRFVSGGGHAILIGAMPETDLDYARCTLLKEFCGDPKLTNITAQNLVLNIPDFGTTIYNTSPVSGITELPAGAALLARETRHQTITGYRLEKNGGSITWLGVHFLTQTFDQVRFLEWLLEANGGTPLIASSNRNVMTTLWESQEGKKLLFVMNLYSSPQETDITLYPGSKIAMDLGHFSLSAMEVKALDI